LEWRNHPDTLRFFFDPSPIDPDLHKSWFSAVLKNPSCHLLIGEDSSGRSVGVVRFDQKGIDAEIAIYLVPNRRGEGLGHLLLDAAVHWLKENSTVEYVNANVLASNKASLKMFLRSKFNYNLHRLTLDIHH
jgi:RimJ/RimL family protein N-acetyltransferase